MSGNVILADLVYYFHVLTILFVVITPFTNIISLLILHVTFCICLLLHWKMNSNVCSLSILESYLRGVERTDTFTHQFVAPMYDISSTQWCDISTILTIVLLFISFSKILNSEKFSKTWYECKEIYNKEYTDKIDKFIDFYKCIAINMLS